MRRGVMSPAMWIVIGMLVLLAVTVLILQVKDASFGVVDYIRGILP